MIHQLSIKDINFSYTTEAQKFVCNKCEKIVYDIYVTACNHIFCFHCIDFFSFECPIDKINIKKAGIIKAKFLDDYLNEFRCNCKLKLEGCKWEGTIMDFYNEHSKSCQLILDLIGNRIKELNEKNRTPVQQATIKLPEIISGKEYTFQSSFQCSLLNPFVYCFEDHALGVINNSRWRIKLNESNPKNTVALIGVYEIKKDKYEGIESNSTTEDEASLFQSNTIDMLFDSKDKSLCINSNNKEIIIKKIDPTIGLYYPCVKLQTANSSFTLIIDDDINKLKINDMIRQNPILTIDKH